MSLGGGGFVNTFNDVLHDAYVNDDVLIVAAAGNSGNTALSYPASYPSVMSVAAVQIDGCEKQAFRSTTARWRLRLLE